MHAKTGDWLVVESATIERRSRRGLILEVHGTDGGPPYMVRWSDNNLETLVFPGSDAHIAPADPVDAGQSR
jgi:hypothetical protein